MGELRRGIEMGSPDVEVDWKDRLGFIVAFRMCSAVDASCIASKMYFGSLFSDTRCMPSDCTLEEITPWSSSGCSEAFRQTMEVW